MTNKDTTLVIVLCVVLAIGFAMGMMFYHIEIRDWDNSVMTKDTFCESKNMSYIIQYGRGDFCMKLENDVIQNIYTLHEFNGKYYLEGEKKND